MFVPTKPSDLARGLVDDVQPQFALNPFQVIKAGTQLADRRNPFAQTYYGLNTKHDIIELVMRDTGGSTVLYYVDPTARQIDPFMEESDEDVKFFSKLPDAYTRGAPITQEYEEAFSA